MHASSQETSAICRCKQPPTNRAGFRNFVTVAPLSGPVVPLQSALPAASGNRSAGATHGTGIPCTTPLALSRERLEKKRAETCTIVMWFGNVHLIFEKIMGIPIKRPSQDARVFRAHQVPVATIKMPPLATDAFKSTLLHRIAQQLPVTDLPCGYFASRQHRLFKRGVRALA